MRFSLGCEYIGASFVQADTDDALNGVVGVCGRVGRVLPSVDPNMIEKLRMFVRKWCKTNLTPLPPETDVSVETWLANSNYSKSKKKELMKLYEETIMKGANPDDMKHRYLKCFIKNEPYASYKNPRGIFARKDDFKILVGPIFKAIENCVFDCDYFIKKVPVDERPAYLKSRFGNLCGVTDRDGDQLLRILVTDYTSFESSFQEELMVALEFEMYQYLTQLLPEGFQFMHLVRKFLGGQNSCYFRNFMVQILACRMSGEMNTSLGNGFSNLMVFLFAMEEHKCSGFDAVFEGDDALATYKGPKISSEWYGWLGFTIKMKYIEECNTASFCGQVFDYESLTVIADPTKIILNLAWCDTRYMHSSEKCINGLLRSKALSIFHQYPGAPILQSMAMAYLRLTQMYRYKLDASWSNYERKIKGKLFQRPVTPKTVSIHARELMATMFGYSVSDQLLLESYFDSLISIAPIWHPVIDDHVTTVMREFNDLYVTKGGDDFTICPIDRLDASLNLQTRCLQEIRKADSGLASENHVVPREINGKRLNLSLRKTRLRYVSAVPLVGPWAVRCLGPQEGQ